MFITKLESALAPGSRSAEVAEAHLARALESVSDCKSLSAWRGLFFQIRADRSRTAADSSINVKVFVAPL